MPRKKHRKTEPPRLMKVRDRDIPDWFREIPCPSENDLATCLTNLRWDFSPFVALKIHIGLSPESDEPGVPEDQAWIEYFDAVVDRALELEAATDYSDFSYLIQLLDLLPGLLKCHARYPWLLERLQTIFITRSYDAFRVYRGTLGRLPTDKNERIKARYDLFMAFGYSEADAIHAILDEFQELGTARAVQLAIERLPVSAPSS